MERRHWKVFLDTSALIAGIFSPTGAAHESFDYAKWDDGASHRKKKGRAASGVEARPHSVKATCQILEGSGPESVLYGRQLALGNR
jgi:hypothetical protein